MKNLTTFLVCAIFCILCSKVYARSKSPHDVYDVKQYSDLTSGFQNFTFNDDTDPLTSLVFLKDGRCNVKDSFISAHKDVSQVHVIFPTKSLSGIWNNVSYLIGFTVMCETQKTKMSNTNWYFFRQSGESLDPKMQYTSFAMDVGKCRKPVFTSDFDKLFLPTSSRMITKMEILFKTHGKKSDIIHMGSKRIRTGSYLLQIDPNQDCAVINNFVPLYISNVGHQ